MSLNSHSSCTRLICCWASRPAQFFSHIFVIEFDPLILQIPCQLKEWWCCMVWRWFGRQGCAPFVRGLSIVAWGVGLLVGTICDNCCGVRSAEYTLPLTTLALYSSGFLYTPWISKKSSPRIQGQRTSATHCWKVTIRIPRLKRKVPLPFNDAVSPVTVYNFNSSYRPSVAVDTVSTRAEHDTLSISIGTWHKLPTSVQPIVLECHHPPFGEIRCS